MRGSIEDAGIIDRILGESRSGHQKERLSWDTVQGNQRYNTGGLVSPTLFNVAVDSVVCHWLSLTVEDEAVIQDGLGHAMGQSLRFFNAGGGIHGSQDPERIPGALSLLIGLFWRIMLVANV